MQVDLLTDQWTALMTNIAKGDVQTYNKPVFPKGEITGVGFHEAPRGALGHWVTIEDTKIINYQCIVPTTWNASPWDAQGQIGAYEAALLDTPLAVADHPLEILRTIHSFDPCLACATHVMAPDGRELTSVKVR